MKDKFKGVPDEFMTNEAALKAKVCSSPVAFPAPPAFVSSTECVTDSFGSASESKSSIGYDGFGL